MSRVTCYCDTCGKKKTCAEDEPAPRGWFYFEVHDPDGNLEATVLACSTDCMVLPWKKYAPTKKEKKDG